MNNCVKYSKLRFSANMFFCIYNLIHVHFRRKYHFNTKHGRFRFIVLIIYVFVFVHLQVRTVPSEARDVDCLQLELQL